MNTSIRKDWFHEIPIMHVFYGVLLCIITLGIFGSQWEYVLSHTDLPSHGVFTAVFVVLGLLWIFFGFLIFLTAMKLSKSWYSSLFPKFLLFETFMGDYRTAKNTLKLAFAGVITMYVWVDFVLLVLRSAHIVSWGMFGVLALIALVCGVAVLFINLNAYSQLTSVDVED